VEQHGANTNYSTLLEWLRRMLKEDERLALVTFNYDPLLDQHVTRSSGHHRR